MKMTEEQQIARLRVLYPTLGEAALEEARFHIEGYLRTVIGMIEREDAERLSKYQDQTLV
jgi:hypothetical protein